MRLRNRKRIRRRPGRPISSIAWACGIALWLPTSAAAAGAPVDPAVLAAEAERIATIDKIVQPTIAIFDRRGQGGGSGVLISSDGYALTNYHVTAPCGPAMKCGLADGRYVDAVLVGLDPGGDIALIKLLDDDGDFPVAQWGDSDQVRVGQWAYVAGNPFLLADDFQPTVSYGIISGVHRYQYPAGTLLEYADCLQTDAAVNPGNSGGPLFNAEGQLIGINGRCSFEKRGRVNVGVGYAVSINQIERFLSHLKSGRLVDHATLGAVVSTDVDGRVMVVDILEDSDAYRRDLRYGDEIVQFGGRDIATANDFKNVLGTYPQGWRVPLVFRRDGQRFERLVRLDGVHREGELAALLEQGAKPPLPERQPGDEPPQPEQPAASSDEVPEAIEPYYEPRNGFANYWFNRYHQQRVGNAYLARGDFADTGWNWHIDAQDAGGNPVEIELAEEHGTIVMPIGESAAEFTRTLGEELGPPRSGGLLAAMHLWQRMMLLGPRRFGEVTYFGQLPWPGDDRMAECLVGIYGGAETRFYFDPTEGDLLGLEMQAAEGLDPCALEFSEIRNVDGRRLPHHWVVRHGDETFAELQITSFRWPDDQAPRPAEQP